MSCFVILCAVHRIVRGRFHGIVHCFVICELMPSFSCSDLYVYVSGFVVLVSITYIYFYKILRSVTVSLQYLVLSVHLFLLSFQNIVGQLGTSCLFVICDYEFVSSYSGCQQC